MLIDANFCTEKQLKILINQHELERKDSTDRVFKPRENPNVSVEIFGCIIDDRPDSLICQTMAEAITSILKKEGRVFIANHTQAYSLEDIPGIAELANRIKADYPKTLQVYTQEGMGSVRYYTDKLINYHNDGYGMPDNGTFKTWPKLSDLQEIDAFKPNIKLSFGLHSG
ncbi:hypothetical protein Lfee_2290 [Legionella feeleii]|uniref:Uncharacterized protein n=1 Tax=Legionella feeleii TaxID=453 RepID=A0A0W0TK34_9GAMM|nr:hypothetical protein Lfee_2290 [Legionella feeleii]SPX60312.1 Uncharacterised protein [Legionella feeleii]